MDPLQRCFDLKSGSVTIYKTDTHPISRITMIRMRMKRMVVRIKWYIIRMMPLIGHKPMYLQNP